MKASGNKKHHDFCDSKVAAISHTVWSGAVAKAGERQQLESHMEMGDSLVESMQDKPSSVRRHSMEIHCPNVTA